jgi:hypothetical protein
MPAASGGNNVLSGDGIIDPRMPEQGIRSFAEQGKTLVPVTEQDLKDYRYGQYLDRMAMGAQSLEAQNFQVPSNLAQQVLATSAVTAPLAAFLAATDPGGTVGPNQAQAEVAVLAAQSAVPMGAASRSWGISRRVAGGLSKVAGAAEGTAGFFPDVETALRAKFVKTVTSGTNLDAGAQKTALQAAIDGGKTLGIAGGAYAAATGLSAIEGVPGELKQAAWTAANLYSGYKGGMFVARQLRSASGFAKTVLKEVADPAQGLDVGARMRVAANPDVPDFVRNVLRNPSSFRAMESTPARLAKNQALSPVSRAVFGKLSDYRFVQAARLAKDTASGVPKGIVANVPFAAGAMASDDPERAGQMLAAGGVFGAMGGAAGRFTEARQRSVERAEGDIARLLVDIQAGNELGSGLGGDILRNRIRPGTQFQDGPGGFVLNPDREVSAFLTEVEMAGGDVSAFVRGKSFDELAQWAAYQGFFRDKVDLVPLNATDFKLNAEANGQNGAGAYFLQPSEGRRARVFVNAESRRNGLAPHEYGHAVLRGGALSPDQIDAVHAEINARYAPDALRNMAGEYAATMVRAENAKQGINIEPSPAAITAKVNELSQGSMIKGSADGLDWLREEIFAEEFRNANIDMNRARRNIPLGANPVSFFENLLGAQSRALHMAGIDIDPQTGKPMGRDQIFKENRVAAGDPVVMKNYEDYVKQWRRWINDPTHEADPGVPLSKTGNPQDTANSPNVTWKDYGRGRMETEFAVKNPDGSVTPKDWKRDIKPTVKARQQAVREMSNRSKEVAAADDQTFGMRRRRDGRLETSGRRLPDSFFFIPQYKPFHDILRKINAADDIGETLQVRFFAKGKSKDVFKDGIKNTSAVNREALHGNFVAKKDGTLMWGWLDMTQFRNRAMKAIADKNPALAQYDWSLKAIMDDLPVHLTDQRRGKGGAFSVGPERANILNGLIGIGDGPLVGAFGKGTAYKTIHLDSINAIVPTGKTGGEFDVYRANRNAMPDDPKPPVDMETDVDNNRMPQQIPREAQGMPDAVDALTTDQLQRQYEENQGYLGLSTLGMREGRPVRGGAAQTRELLRRNEAISAELQRRGVREEDPQLQRALQRRGQAMPDAQPAEVRQDGLVVAPPEQPAFKLTPRAIAQFMPDAGVDLANYADRTVIALPADRMGIGEMMVGPKGKERAMSVKGQGGAGFMQIYNGGGWAFSDEATGGRFMKRLREAAEPGEGSVIVGITAMSEFNHLKNQTGQLAYVEALEAAIAGRSISKKQADAHIKEIAQAIVRSEAVSVGDSTRRKFAAIKNFADFSKAVRAKSLNFADASPYAVQIARKKLPIPYKEAKDIGISFEDIGKQTADPRYADVPFGTVVALLEVPLDQSPVKSDFHYSYPFKVTGNRIGFLKQYYPVGELTSDPRIRNKAGAVQAQPLQTVLPKMDRIGKVTAQFMPDAAPADAPPFYMKSAQVLDAKIQGKAATVDQVRAILTNPQNGIKAEELKWTGALQAAERLAKENNGKVPKDALLKYLEDDGAVRLEEVTMSELGRPEARYSPYQLDGGRNYREVILTMPDPLDSKRYARMNEIEATLSSVKSVSQEEIARLRDEYRNLSDAASNYRGYTSSHFNTPNYVAHMRLNERVDASGRPGLFLEEIQSDRHQEGREKGYQDNDPKDTTGWTVEIKQNPAFPNTRVAEVRDSEGVQIDFQYNVPDNFTESEAIRLAASKAVPYKIPDAPFRKDWPLQMFKRALSDAVLGGKEWIGWTTGETQAARYDKQLADNLDTIEVRKDEDGQSFYVLGYKNKREVIDSGAVSQNKLSDLIGKDMAAKAIESKDGEVTFSGKDLTIGGKGMEGFYDQILPKEISKYVKQWDGKVEKVKIGLQNALEELRFNLFNPENRAVTAFLTMEEAQAAAKKAGKGYTVRETPLKNPTPIWRVNITPQMRESIKKAGQALFVGGSAAVVAEEEL